MSTFELAKEFISDHRYQILDEDSTDMRIAFRFQMNTIYFWSNNDDKQFFFMTLTNFDNVTNKNIARIKENCHQVNKDAKLVKMYVLNDIALAVAEIYYLAKDDFNFQMMNALKHLIAVKGMYKKLDK